MRLATYSGLALALLGPGLIALVADRLANLSSRLSVRALGFVAFVVLVAAVVAIARRTERLSWSEVGFGKLTWASVPWAAALTLFFVLVYGPLADAALARLDLGTFDTGRAQLAPYPVWYLVMTIVVVAAGEEWLYRGYAIERLEAVTGSTAAAAALSLAAFGVAHLPLWGIGVALSTVVSGAVFTLAYVWRRDIFSLMLAHVTTDLYGLVISSAQHRSG